MGFYDELEKRGLLSLLHVNDYVPPSFSMWDKVGAFLLDIVRNKRSVYVEGDYDVDGLMCALIIRDCLTDLGIDNLSIYNYRKRTHNIDSVAVQQCIQGHYDYFIVADTGSSDLGLLNAVTKCGVKAIVLDHHNTELGYEDFGENIAIINTVLENGLGRDFKLSAGALCFTVFDLLYRELGREAPVACSAYAAISLLADIMDMSDGLNRGIYNLAMRIPEDELPPSVLYFKGRYNKFNARYISYWFSPRVNACFRSEQFIFLNGLFLNRSDAPMKSKCIEMIEQVYTKSRDMVHGVSDALDAYSVKMQHFVFADLASISGYFDLEGDMLYNYTGYVANDLAAKAGKTAVVVCPIDNYYKGSLRDQFGRDYLSIFKQICFAEGHNAAFGIKIPRLDFDSFLKDLHMVDDLYSIQTINDEPIIVDIGSFMPDESMLRDMAHYNELASPGVPVALLRKKFIGNIKEQKSAFGYRYAWGNLTINSNYRVGFGRTVLIKPFYSWRLKLQVQ